MALPTRLCSIFVVNDNIMNRSSEDDSQNCGRGWELGSNTKIKEIDFGDDT